MFLEMDEGRKNDLNATAGMSPSRIYRNRMFPVTEEAGPTRGKTTLSCERITGHLNGPLPVTQT